MSARLGPNAHKELSFIASTLEAGCWKLEPNPGGHRESPPRSAPMEVDAATDAAK